MVYNVVCNAQCPVLIRQMLREWRGPVSSCTQYSEHTVQDNDGCVNRKYTSSVARFVCTHTEPCCSFRLSLYSPVTGKKPAEIVNSLSQSCYSKARDQNCCKKALLLREAVDLLCPLPPVRNIRAVIWFHFPISSLVWQPSPLALCLAIFRICSFNRGNIEGLTLRKVMFEVCFVFVKGLVLWIDWGRGYVWEFFWNVPLLITGLIVLRWPCAVDRTLKYSY